VPSVLICDDHRLFAESLALALERRGYDVTHVPDPRSAVSAVRQCRVDVCILDRHFPAADGLDAIAPLREAAPGMRIVVLSGTGSHEVQRRAEAEGAEFVSKDQPMRELVAVAEGGCGPYPSSAPPPVPPAWETAVARSLTGREREVLARMVAGQGTKPMARELGITYATARSHIQSILTKLNVHSKLEAVAYAVGQGLVPAPGRTVAGASTDA
jgi:two-component system nitrate/nitrite response regulator NarL